MLRNNIKTAIRSLWKQKLNTGINLLGLTLGLSCAVLAFVIIRHEYSYDKFHEEHEQIYWFRTQINNRINLSSTPGALGPILEENFTEVTDYLRIETSAIQVKLKNELFREFTHLVDENFFTFFQLPLIHGEKKTVLSRLNTLVLSETMAEKYFGRKDPVGESMTILINGNETLFEIAGVMKDPPTNSSLQPDIVMPVMQAYQDDPSALNSWESFPVGSFVRIRKGTKPEEFESKYAELIESRLKEVGLETKYAFYLNSLDDYHLKSRFSVAGLTGSSETSYINILAIIGSLILLIACFNYMNLSNAQGSHRLKEVGIRQVMGAKKNELIVQFLVESVLLSLLALGLAILLIEPIFPIITRFVDFELSIDWDNPSIFFPLLGIALVTGLLAGFYPSFLLSKLDVVHTFKSNLKIGKNNLLTKSTLAFQFVLSIGLLCCTLIMYQQQQFVKNRNLGFEQEQVLVIYNQVDPDEPEDTELLVNRFRAEALQLETVVAVAGVSNSFNRGERAIFIEEEDGRSNLLSEYRIDPYYIDLLNIEIKEGRNFLLDQKEEKAIIVNEAFIREYEINDIDSYRLPENFKKMTNAKIIGVVKDFHFLDLHSQIPPVVLGMDADIQFEHMLVKLSGKDVEKVIAGLRSIWQSQREGKTFQYSFMDADIQQQYEADRKWNTVIATASLLAILIAVLGLLGLVTLSLAQRTKEISIRKIIGASVGQIVALFSSDFLKLIGIATLIASPIAWYFMQQWLEDYAYRIEIQWWIFVIAGFITVGIAFLTVSLQSIRAALVNPVDSLRNE